MCDFCWTPGRTDVMELANGDPHEQINISSKQSVVLYLFKCSCIITFSLLSIFLALVHFTKLWLALLFLWPGQTTFIEPNARPFKITERIGDVGSGSVVWNPVNCKHDKNLCQEKRVVIAEAMMCLCFLRIVGSTHFNYCYAVPLICTVGSRFWKREGETLHWKLWCVLILS